MIEPAEPLQTCPNCGAEVASRYCPHCGLQSTGKRVTFFSALSDLVDSFYSVDKSVFTNFRDMLLRPQKVIGLYLQGYRGYYFSPGRYLLLAAAMLGLNFWVADNLYFSAQFDVVGFAGQILFLFLFIPIFTFSNWLTYLRFKLNLTENLVLVSYNFGFWMILFSAWSIILSFTELEMVKNVSIVLNLLLILAWNSRFFSMRPMWRLFYFVINLFLLAASGVAIAFLLAVLTDVNVSY